MGIEKLPSNSDPDYRATTNSVPVAVGTTAAEGRRQAEAGQAAFDAALRPRPRPIPGVGPGPNPTPGKI